MVSGERPVDATDMFCKEFRNQNLITLVMQIYLMLRKHSLTINMLCDLDNDHNTLSFATA